MDAATQLELFPPQSVEQALAIDCWEAMPLFGWFPLDQFIRDCDCTHVRILINPDTHRAFFRCESGEGPSLHPKKQYYVKA